VVDSDIPYRRDVILRINDMTAFEQKVIARLRNSG
jgi:hypothetical protein